MTNPLPNRDQLLAQLRRFGQEHLLRFWEELDATGRHRLAEQIAAIDCGQIAALYRQGASKQDWATLARQAAAAPAVRIAERQAQFHEARQCGRAALDAGKVGVLLVAGGQGSRLGFDHPKGLFPIGPVSGASLLQIHLEKVLALGRRHGVRVPLYMMTSPVTHDEQVAFLSTHEFFGLGAEDVTLFCQGTMPAVEADTGRLLLAEKDSLFLSPDGHGGTVAALAASAAIADMRRRGIEHLFYLQVDNPLAPIGDAEMVGRHILASSDLTSMAVAKQTPQDRLGVFATIDGLMHVIEYSDLPYDVSERRDSNGDLEFWAGSIAVHVFSVGFLERSLGLKDAMPFHIAHKKVSYIDYAGRRREPKVPNALKFERFIFDLIPHAKNPLVIEYAEEEVFAPLKNGPDAERDTAEYVQRFMIAQHRRWLEAAGTRVADGVPVEISPLWAVDAEEVMTHTHRPREIKSRAYLR